ncbi:hypothetical protein CHH28_13520 [Bacterioplanes sanyensis]|uniref:Uncharacterized protein n=1 Tax=Bacterioplanes sanyensis TaxID=1249553 RepID=A0A222FKT5_9GAMM|nr:hypothetical protein [Bacterioplanes sanyensis]ASP39628.1 hypothetical protein CHH28_13520 [Bacterioplanes sanyensis]
MGDFDLVWEQAGFPFFHDNYIYTYSGGKGVAMINSPIEASLDRIARVVKILRVCYFIQE